MRLDGLATLITGGASGIGLGVAQRFLSEGARVAIMDRSETSLASARDLFPQLITVLGDVTSFNDNLRAVADTVAAFGRLDVFVGNAGIFDHYMTLDKLPADGGGTAFDELFGIDVKGYLFGAKAAAGALRESRGTMVFTASVSGLHPAYGGILYIPAKHAVVGLVRRLALELAPEIRVNGVAPGFVPTPLSGIDALKQGKKDPSVTPPLSAFPMARIPSVEEYASLYAFLASHDSVNLVGQVLNADHGLTLQRFG